MTTPARKAALQWFHDQKQVREAWKHPWEIPGSPTKKMINLMLDDRQLTWTHGQGHFLTDKGRRMLHGDDK